MIDDRGAVRARRDRNRRLPGHESFGEKTGHGREERLVAAVELHGVLMDVQTFGRRLEAHVGQNTILKGCANHFRTAQLS